ncbi:hypothetical protein AMTRI_Chr04g248620 [Amborella trichopoda]
MRLLIPYCDRATSILREYLNVKRIPFSAFWLRSSVVFVLISLIFDTWPIGSHDIKLIFQGGRGHRTSLLVGSSSVAHALHYCMGLVQPYKKKKMLSKKKDAKIFKTIYPQNIFGHIHI